MEVYTRSNSTTPRKAIPRGPNFGPPHDLMRGLDSRPYRITPRDAILRRIAGKVKRKGHVVPPSSPVVNFRTIPSIEGHFVDGGPF